MRKEPAMEITLEPHFRIDMLPTFSIKERNGFLHVLVDMVNTGNVTLETVYITAVAYSQDNEPVEYDESREVALHPGEKKTARIVLDRDAKNAARIKVYAESERDGGDPWHRDPELPPPSWVNGLVPDVDRS